MSYETCPSILATYSDEQWETLLASVWNAPVPRRLVRIVREPTLKQRIEAMLRRGMARKQIAADLNVSLSTISLHLSGKRG